MRGGALSGCRSGSGATGEERAEGEWSLEKAALSALEVGLGGNGILGSLRVLEASRVATGGGGPGLLLPLLSRTWISAALLLGPLLHVCHAVT
jgi:hypothetical protein